MTVKRYSTLAICLHWAIAALLLFQISLGWRLEDLPKGMAQFHGFQLHKSVGISILLLSVLRLLVRVTVRRPEPAPGTPAVRFLASAVHALLYAVMIVGPITGWILVSNARVKMQTMLFGALPWPNLPAMPLLREPSDVIHGALGWVGIGLIVLHVAGAIHHHAKGEDLVARMIPVMTRRALTIGLIVAIVGAIAAMAAAKVWPFGGGAAATPVSAAVPSAQPTSASPSSASALDPQASSTPEPAASEALAAASAAPVPSATDWKVAPGGRLGFRAEYSGEAVNGTFGRWDAAIRFSPEDLAHSAIKVTVDLASVSTADGQRDDMLKGNDFFGVTAHPNAVFTSSRIADRGNGAYAAAGTLSLNGHARPVTLAFHLTIKGNRAIASGSGSIQRTAFGVGTGEWAATDTIQDGVAISFALTATRADQAGG